MDIIINVMWFTLIVFALLFCISGIDDLFFDIFYWVHFVYRKWKTRKYKPLTYENLVSVKEKKIAILVPCWQESDVIAPMLKYNIDVIDYDNYDFFIAAYPNDVKTIKAVQALSKRLPHVHCLINSQPGPTTKADNLNSAYFGMREYEKKNNVFYEIIILHDSEDIIHPLSLKLFNYLIPKKEMVQLPVFPLEVPWRNFTHWVYNDEFVENHTKDIVVREAIGGLVPSAGVGTGFARSTIENLALSNEGLPFTVSILTEDYDTALQIRLRHLKQIFVTQTVKRTQMKKRWVYFGKEIPKIVKEYVATRSLFPMQYKKAVRQKRRWIMGIALQEWAHAGWHGSLPTLYTLLHDRKSAVTHYINALGYFIFMFWLIYSFWQRYHPEHPTLQDFFNAHRWVWYLIIFCTLLMLERLLQRMIAVYRIYGFIPALLSLPRTIYGNFINMHALFLAYWDFFIKYKMKKNITWKKTKNLFPTMKHLKEYRHRLGDLLLAEKIINKRQLIKALSAQNLTGKKIGEILLEKKYINENDLIKLLAQQYHLPIVSHYKTLSHNQLPDISKRNYNWLIKNKIFPIELHEQRLTIVIQDPTNEELNNELTKKIFPYKAHKVMSNDT